MQKTAAMIAIYVTKWLAVIRGLLSSSGRSGVIGAAGMMFVSVTLWRFAELNADVGVCFLYTIPVSLLAVLRSVGRHMRSDLGSVFDCCVASS